MAYGTDDNDNTRHYGETGSASDDSPSYWGVSSTYPDDYYRPYIGDFPLERIQFPATIVPPAFLYDPEPAAEPRKSPLERIADALEALVGQGKASAASQTYITWNATTTPLFDYSQEDEGLPETLTVGADDAVFVAAEDYWDQSPAMDARDGWETGMLTKTDDRYPVGFYGNDGTQKGYFYQVSNKGLEILGIERQ